MTRRALGKGLGALMPQIADSPEVGNEIAVDQIVPNPYQPRREFSEEALVELVESIRQRGVLQPISVRRKDGRYELVAGERRLRAAKRAGLKTIPAVVHDLSDQEVMEVALIENLQREDLNPIEEALAFQRLLDEFGLTQEEVSKAVGKSRSTIANSLRLLSLSDTVRSGVAKGEISAGHARALLAFEPKDQVRLYKRILSEGLTVRQVERLAKGQRQKSVPRQRALDPLVRDVEERLQGVLGTKVTIQPGGKKRKGKIEVEYYSNDDLHRILEIVTGRDF